MLVLKSHVLIGKCVTAQTFLCCEDLFDLGGIVSQNIGHSMDQILRGFMFGVNDQKPWALRSYIFANRNNAAQRDVVTFLIRRELQQGDQRDSQGRQAWHWHLLSWHKSLQGTKVADYLFAHLPTDGSHVAVWMDDVQRSNQPRPYVSTNPTHWSDNRLLVYYPEESHQAGYRPCLRQMLLLADGHSYVHVATQCFDPVVIRRSFAKLVSK